MTYSTYVNESVFCPMLAMLVKQCGLGARASAAAHVRNQCSLIAHRAYMNVDIFKKWGLWSSCLQVLLPAQNADPDPISPRRVCVCVYVPEVACVQSAELQRFWVYHFLLP